MGRGGQAYLGKSPQFSRFLIMKAPQEANNFSHWLFYTLYEQSYILSQPTIFLRWKSTKLKKSISNKCDECNLWTSEDIKVSSALYKSQ